MRHQAGWVVHGKWIAGSNYGQNMCNDDDEDEYVGEEEEEDKVEEAYLYYQVLTLELATRFL